GIDCREGKSGGHLAYGGSRDDVGGGTGDRLPGDQVHGPVPRLREELCDGDDKDRGDDADHATPEEVARVGDTRNRLEVAVGDECVGDQEKTDERDDGRHHQAGVQTAHDPAREIQANRHGADHGAHDRYGAQQERVHDPGDVVEKQGAQQHGGNHRDGVCLEQVGRHSSAVADVVADVVSDDCGVARVILRDAGLDLADQVGADVGGLGVDATAEAGEHRD